MDITEKHAWYIEKLPNKRQEVDDPGDAHLVAALLLYLPQPRPRLVVGGKLVPKYYFIHHISQRITQHLAEINAIIAVSLYILKRNKNA